MDFLGLQAFRIDNVYMRIRSLEARNRVRLKWIDASQRIRRKYITFVLNQAKFQADNIRTAKNKQELLQKRQKIKYTTAKSNWKILSSGILLKYKSEYFHVVNNMITHKKSQLVAAKWKHLSTKIRNKYMLIQKGQAYQDLLHNRITVKYFNTWLTRRKTKITNKRVIWQSFMHRISRIYRKKAMISQYSLSNNKEKWIKIIKNLQRKVLLENLNDSCIRHNITQQWVFMIHCKKIFEMKKKFKVRNGTTDQWKSFMKRYLRIKTRRILIEDKNRLDLQNIWIKFTNKVNLNDSIKNIIEYKESYDQERQEETNREKTCEFFEIWKQKFFVLKFVRDEYKKTLNVYSRCYANNSASMIQAIWRFNKEKNFIKHNKDEISMWFMKWRASLLFKRSFNVFPEMDSDDFSPDYKIKLNLSQIKFTNTLLAFESRPIIEKKKDEQNESIIEKIANQAVSNGLNLEAIDEQLFHIQFNQSIAPKPEIQAENSAISKMLESKIHEFFNILPVNFDFSALNTISSTYTLRSKKEIQNDDEIQKQIMNFKDVDEKMESVERSLNSTQEDIPQDKANDAADDIGGDLDDSTDSNPVQNYPNLDVPEHISIIDDEVGPPEELKPETSDSSDLSDPILPSDGTFFTTYSHALAKPQKTKEEINQQTKENINHENKENAGQINHNDMKEEENENLHHEEEGIINENHNDISMNQENIDDNQNDISNNQNNEENDDNHKEISNDQENTQQDNVHETKQSNENDESHNEKEEAKIEDKENHDEMNENQEQNPHQEEEEEANVEDFVEDEDEAEESVIVDQNDIEAISKNVCLFDMSFVAKITPSIDYFVFK